MQLDLANDGLGAGLGLDMTSGSDGEFQGLGLRCARFPRPAVVHLEGQSADVQVTVLVRSEFLQSLNDPPLYTPDQPSQPQQIGGLPINTDTGLTVPPEHAAGLADPKDTGKSTGPSVPGSPINKCVARSPSSSPRPSRSSRLAVRDDELTPSRHLLSSAGPSASSSPPPTRRTAPARTGSRASFTPSSRRASCGRTTTSQATRGS